MPPVLVDFTDSLSHTAVYTLSDGSLLLVERTVTYGDMMIVSALIALLLVVILIFVFRLALRRW